MTRQRKSVRRVKSRKSVKSVKPRKTVRTVKSPKTKSRKSVRTVKSRKSVRSVKSPKTKSRKSVRSVKSPKTKSRKSVRSVQSPKTKSRKSVRTVKSRKSSPELVVEKPVEKLVVEKPVEKLVVETQVVKKPIVRSIVEKSDDEKLNDKIFSDIKNWLIISQDPLKRIEWLNNVLSIYNFPFFDGKSRTEELVRQTLFRDDYYNKMKESCVWVAASTPAYKKQIVESLIHRFPVYMGKKLLSWMNSDKMLKHFPYLRNESDDANHIIYTLGSFVPSYQTGSDNIRLIGMLHTWGVNFEKDESPDYKKMVHDGIVDRDGYRQRVRDMFSTIFKASRKLRFKGRYELRIPALGLGAYLSGLKSENEKNKCKNIFMEELLSASMKMNDGNGTVYFCDLNRDNYSRLPSNNTVVKYKNDLLKITNTDPDVIIVNAWDSHSFIGNGGSRDNTIDGMIGAGINRYIECAAYAQNPFFIPEMVWKLEYV